MVPSSDGIEIVSAAPRVRPDPARPSASTRTPDVITLSDEDSPDERPRQRSAATATRTTTRTMRQGEHGGDDDDDDVVVVAGSLRPAHATSSDDLEPLSTVWANEAATAGTSRGPLLGRSASMAVASSSINPTVTRLPQRSHTLGVIPDFEIVDPSSSSSSPLRPLATASRANGKGKQRAREEFDDAHTDLMPPRPQRARSDDLWADILGSDSDGAAAKKKKGKGKAKAKASDGDGTRKRLLSSDGESGEDGTTKKRKSPGKKAPRLSAEDKASKKEQAAAERANKAALKRQETADRAKLREANALRTKDKTATAAELTIHISGTAFKALEYDGSDTESEDGGAGSRTGRGKRKKKEKPSPWLEITQQLSEKMDAHKCAVERPEYPRRDIGCEGAIRWTRVCTTKWDDQRNLFLPLPDGQPIIVEEDSRLIFLTAYDLSLHIAHDTLSRFMTNLQSQLPPHINLFVLLYGLQTVFRDLERVRQAEYRRDLQRRAGEPDGPVIKPAGIGQGQPSKDELELAIMRMQVKSKCMIVSVDKVDEAVEWLEQLSFDVGQKPYQRHKQSHITQLGTGEANIVSGKTLQDTYIKMLASLKGVTDAVAAGIAGEYPTMRSLLEAYDTCRGGEKGKQEMLIAIGKGRNIDGTKTHRAIGATLSANIYRMLTSRNPDMLI
ncbi:hypothetical protein JCM11491_002674 [Sporobolomyces phaffii]